MKVVDSAAEDDKGDDSTVSAASLYNSAPPSILLIPSASFQKVLDFFLKGLDLAFPTSPKVGGVASTVSSLSKDRVFYYNDKDPDAVTIQSSGVVGVTMKGDIEIKPMVAQGARPVGPIYVVVDGGGSTIRAIGENG